MIFPKELTHGLSWKIKVDLSLFLVYIFSPKAWVNPFGKIRFFWDFERLHFLWPKKVSFRAGTLLSIISSLFLTETTQENKTYIFWPKAWVNPLEKCDFWDFERLKFLLPKKVSFLSRTLLNIISIVILRETNKKNYGFWPKAWINPFEKIRFLGLWKTKFFMAKKGFF